MLSCLLPLVQALASVDALETSGLFRHVAAQQRQGLHASSERAGSQGHGTSFFLLCRVGGVMMSLTDSGQQWDAPNVWPPVGAGGSQGGHRGCMGLQFAGVMGRCAVHR